MTTKQGPKRFAQGSGRATVSVGIAVGLVAALLLLRVDGEDERHLATLFVTGSAAIVALLVWALGRRNRSACSFAAGCAGLAIGTYLALPMDIVRIEWTLRADKAHLERVRAELNERVARGDPLPDYGDLATDSRWGAPKRPGGRFYYRRDSDREFELMVGEPRNRRSPWGIHRLDSVTGEWRYEDKPFLFVYFEK